MKNCFSCDNMLTDDAAYCYVCSTHQNSGFETFEAKQKVNDTFLKVLCILTIVGASIQLISLPFNQASAAAFGIEPSMFVLVAGLIAAAGKITGAIFMLMKKLTGLYIYTAAAVLRIVVALYGAATFSSDLPGMGPFVVVAAVVSVIFLIGFLVMYWLPVNRRVLS